MSLAQFKKINNYKIKKESLLVLRTKNNGIIRKCKISKIWLELQALNMNFRKMLTVFHLSISKINSKDQDQLRITLFQANISESNQ